MPSPARPRESGEPVLGNVLDARLRGHERPQRSVRLCAPEVLVDRRADGTIYLKSGRALPAYPEKLTDRLVHWANAAPERVFMAERAPDGGWRTITYAQTLERVRRIGAALLTRNLSAERPIVILSGNDLEHALLGLAANYVGIPYAPISPAYSLISSDFGKLKHIFNLLTPGLVYACNAQYQRAIASAVPLGTEVIVGSLDKLDAAPEAADAAHARVTGDTIAKFLFTSGSTGIPKGVINTQRMWCSNQAMIASALQFFADEPPVIVDWAPWHHTAGGNHDVGLVLNNGGTLYIDGGKPLPGAIEETVRNLREIAPTWYFTVPKGYEALLPFFRADAALRETLLLAPQGAVVRGRGARAARVRRMEGDGVPHLWRGHPLPHRPRLDRDRALCLRPHVGRRELRQRWLAAAWTRREARSARRG